MLNQTAGLDKSLKLAQYTLQLLATFSNSKHAQSLAKPISEARVTMRIFDLPAYSVPAFYAATLKLYQLLAKHGDNKLFDAAAMKKMDDYRGAAASSSNSSAKGDDGTFETAARISQRKADLLALKEWLYACSLFVYYVGECGYWLSGNKVVEGLDTYWWSRVSCRGWLAYLVLEIKNQIDQLRNASSDNGESEITSDSTEDLTIQPQCKGIVLQLTDQRKRIMRLIARFSDIFMALQWSVKEGPFPPTFIYACGFVSALMDFTILFHSR